ncbi:hypothetical protein V9T40_012742 [Parthenolecanium corni]|uniref:Dynamin-type G domain-containing protein n=1 Tax=Parthenolecanium corni TaxID=536013 RepID=A0AAN9TNQ5_9HEMI
MAAYINRTISMISADSGSNHSRGLLSTNGDNRHYRESSPLQIFVKAKKKINDIFSEIDDYVQDSCKYVESIRYNEALIDSEEAKKIVEYVTKVKGIRDVLSRDHMKVAFFGRTSSGKSSVINAMLRDKILPSGIGHTTNCFLQVEGSENGEAYLVTEDSAEKKNVKSIGRLAHALCEEKLNEHVLVRIFWPRDKCSLLRDDVVLVDSPGVDITPNLDEWIDKHCLDADVFVLVAHAQSTLMVTEKNFFHKVSQKLSKPNIFLLNNHWDTSASEPEFMEEARVQHTERAIDFLVKELKVCSQKEAAERVFFISAKECLLARTKEQEGLSLQSGALAEGFPTRYFEFQDFERKFEECISKSAVKTKFEQHLQRGKTIASDIRVTMDGLYEKALKLRNDKTEAKKGIYEKLNYTEQRLILLTQQMKEKIQQMVSETEEKVKKALSEEIRRLSVLVEEFNAPFHSDALVLNVYKRELHAHVESGLGSNLRARLSNALAMNIESSQREMTEQMSCLLPADRRQQSFSILTRRQPFEILYRLNCDNLCADFQEDLEFRFSWGVTSLISRFVQGNTRHQMALKNYPSQVPSTPPSSDEWYSQDQSFAHYSGVPRSEEWYTSLISKVAVASVTSQGTIGALLVSGFMLKTIGWRVIFVTGVVYGSLYMYEWMTWTNKAKEKTFKKQYVEHATKKLRLIVDLTSANCSHQVQQELSSTFARLCQLIDQATSDMSSDMKDLEQEIQKLDGAANSAKVLRNKSDYLAKELDMFEETYLRMYN